MAAIPPIPDAKVTQTDDVDVAIAEATTTTAVSSKGKNGVAGDPHAMYRGHKTTFEVPEHKYIKLFQQDDLAVFARGNTPSPKYKFRNYIASIVVKLAGEELVRAEQMLNVTANDAKELPLLEVAVQGKPQATPKSTEPASDVNIAAGTGHEHVHVAIEHSRVVISSRKLKLLIRSKEAKESKKIANHLDFLIEKGLEPDQASGALPEIWGLRPMSDSVKHLLKAPSASFLHLFRGEGLGSPSRVALRVDLH